MLLLTYHHESGSIPMHALALAAAESNFEGDPQIEIRGTVHLRPLPPATGHLSWKAGEHIAGALSIDQVEARSCGLKLLLSTSLQGLVRVTRCGH